MIDGCIIGHRDIGDGLLKALESIAGTCKHIIFFSNDGLSTNELADQIKATFCDSQDDGVIFFVDVYGGSCWRAVKMAKLPKYHIVTGFNLPMLLSFTNKRKTISFDKLHTIMETDGKRGITSE